MTVLVSRLTFQPTPGIAPGWTANTGLRNARPEWFQPTPGIAPGWTPVAHAVGPTDGRVSTHTRDRSRVDLAGFVVADVADPDVSTHTRDRSRVDRPVTATTMAPRATFQPTPGIAPGWTA